MNKNAYPLSFLRGLFALMLCMLALLFTACEDDPEVLGEGEEGYEEPADPDPDPDPGEDDPKVEDSDTFDSLFAEENDTILYSTSEYATGTYSRTIYVDPENGDDANGGTTIAAPIKSLDYLNTIIQDGDEILLKGSTTSEHKGSIILNGRNNVRVGSYGDCKARINAEGRFAGLLIYGDYTSSSFSGITISDLKITADGYSSSWGYGTSDDKYRSDDIPRKTYYNSYYDLLSRYGIMVWADTSAKLSDLVIYNVDIADVYYFNADDTDDTYAIMSYRPCRSWSTSTETEYGYGIRMYAASNAVIDNTKIDNCNIRDVSHTAIKSNNNGKVTNFHVTKTNTFDTGGPGAQFAKVYNGVMDYCKTLRPGSSTEDGMASTRKWGRGSGMWLNHCDGFLFDHNYYYRSEGVADCCGAHIDIGNKNVVIQYCLSVDNCGGFVEVLGQNYNCCYRYNISIDDGWRDVKNDTAQSAFWLGPTGKTIGTDGCLLTVNGTSSGNYDGPYDTYIYNNTVINSGTRYDGYTNTFTFEVATSAEGVLIANNIFYTPLADGDNYSASWSEHSYDIAANGDVTYVDNAVDYKKSISTNGWVDTSTGKTYSEKGFLTNAEVYALNHEIRNNLYQAYDEAAHKTLYPYAENILYDNGNSDGSESGSEDARYRDFNPLGGDPGFPFVGGKNPEFYKAEDAIPTASSVINRGIAIGSNTLRLDGTAYKVSYKQSSESTYESLDLGTDFFGKSISTPIVGACVVQ